VELGGAARPDKVGFGGGAAEVGRRWVGERTDRRVPCVSEGREKGTEDGRRKSKKKTYSAKYANGLRGPMWGTTACQ
jgi:hypothetical protein